MFKGVSTPCWCNTDLRRQGGQPTPYWLLLLQVVLHLLMEKATLRKADVMAAAEAAGLPSPSESQYQRVMKELCRNNGNHWALKTAADM